MAEGTQLSMTDEGRLAVTKRAAAGAGADRLRREARILEQAAHPGVVELLAAGDLDGGAVLHTAFVGGGTLAEQLGALEAAKGAMVAAALATTLADLHDRGIAHRRVTADHVLMAEADRVRLCGLADAAVISEAGACDTEAAAAADIEAVATLVREIAGSPAGADTAALRAVADRVLLADPPARPSMRTLAQALSALTPGAGPSTPPVAPGGRILAARPSAASRRPRLSHGRTAMAVVVVPVLVIGAVLATKGSGPGPSAPVVAAPPPAPGPTDTSTSTSTIEPPGTRVWPTVPRSDPAARPAVVEVAGGVFASSGRRWQVAAPDDLVVIGDWDCDGLATPAVVRPGTGHVWTYANCAEGTECVVADAAWMVPDAISATAVTVDGCHHLEIVDTAGTTTRLDLRP
ncbi:hypothetical protein BH23ACT1_BH23ACT1_07900 [soil metagenome]